MALPGVQCNSQAHRGSPHRLG